MNKSRIESIGLLDKIIVGRVDPHIYAFKTNTIPNYLKIGDTYRPVSQRLNEWRKYFPELEKKYENKAIIDDETYFRDYSIHQFLEKDLSKQRLLPIDLNDQIYYSKEFFKNTEVEDIDDAIEDIKTNYKKNSNKYDYYYSANSLPQIYHYERGEAWDLRPNQKKVVNQFVNAINSGRKNLLMYAVMRFGKSFTSLCCALEIKSKLVLVVSAKADVKEEWKRTVESAGNFEQYKFLDSSDLARDPEVIKVILSKNKKIVLFLTLQDLQGDNVKEKHKELFSEQIDLLIVDETHFGARAESYGKVLKNAGYNKMDVKNIQKLNDESIDTQTADEEIKKLNARIRLHLSGTPYRILMGSEFEKEDIISFVQFSDIVEEQKKWDKENLQKDDVEEWDNPYYGFPQMVRFAFNPNKSSRKKMEALKRSGVSFAFSKLFEPESITLDKKKCRHKKFINEREILELLQVIDGSKEDDGLLSFLDYNKIKSGKMCRHMVMVLPYCATCDAMEELIKTNKTTFKNLNKYEIINISGLESSKIFKTPNDIKNKISECEAKDRKTITLTVNRMLTGSTVEQWDTMLYLKDTASPQEYDQSIFRLQNQYIRTLSGDRGIIRENLKPQTLLVDFDPNRLFRMQEQKSLIYNVNTENNGNSKLRERIQEELRISPIIVMNHNKIKEITATNILEYISEYNNQRSVSDEVLDIPVDLSLLNDEEIRKTIESQGEFNSKQGLTILPNEGEGDDLETEVTESNDDNPEVKKGKNKDYTETKTDKEIQKLESKIKTYYQRILFFSFLTKNEVNSLDDILSVIKSNDNERLAKNLLIDKYVLEKVSQSMDPFKRSRLDYKIQNISMLANDKTMNPIDRAMISIKRFNRMSESEVVTPTKISDDMVNLLSGKSLREIVNKKEKFLDIGCKSGEYAVAIYNRLRSELRFTHDKIKNLIYAIPTSSIAYEFTRKFYEILGLSIENIATNFNAYDLLEIKDMADNVDYEHIKNILEQDKKFCKVKLDEKIQEGDNKVKFGAVVGNPPYHLSDGGAQASAKPIYQHFILLGKELTNKYTCCITPTRWFAGGKGLDEFRDLMLNDHTMRELHDFTTPEDVFPNINNRGGVCYFINDIEKNEDTVRVVTYKDGEVTSDINRTLLVDGIDIFIRDGQGPKIIEKVNTKTKNKMSEFISSLRPFGFRGYFTKNKAYHATDKNLIKPVLCYGKGKQIGYVEKKLIKKNVKFIDVWKVFIARANNIGTELSDDNLNAFIGKPKEICTETYLVVGAELNLNHKSCENLTKYFKTKFARYMHSLSKPSHDSTAKTFRFVPLQDFKEKSDIDWAKSVIEIDEQLFEKYELSEEERNHIKSTIKDM